VTLLLPPAADQPHRDGAFKKELVAAIPKLRAYALALTRSSAEADDLVQESLLRAWKFRNGYQPGGALQAWLCKILRNTYYTSIRARWSLVQDVDGQHAMQLACEPEQEWRVKHLELIKAMGQLTELLRESLLLVVGQGLSYEEAAEVASCPVGTMKSRVNRGRERLAELMGDMPEPPANVRPLTRPTHRNGQPIRHGASPWLVAESAA
jgi:RNA polymerase sigma-70 factor (ECF subfamily)